MTVLGALNSTTDVWYPQYTKLAANFSIVNNAVLTQFPDLTSTVISSGKYCFEFLCRIEIKSNTGGFKIGFGGSCAATALEAYMINYRTGVVDVQVGSGRITALSTGYVAGGTTTSNNGVRVYGTIAINSGGSFYPMGCQNVATSGGTMRFYKGCYFRVMRMD